VSRVLLPLIILALLLSMVAVPLTQAVAQSTFMVWPECYDGGNFDAGLAVAVDSNDNVIVAGCSEIWHEYHADDEAVGTGGNNTTVFTLDNTNVIAGSETIYFNGTAVSPENYAINYTTGKITFDTAPGAGVVITADYDFEAKNYDYYTIKYAPNGTELWNRSYNSGGSDEAHGVAVDSADNIIITGYCDNNYHTIKYTSNGTELWNRTYDSGGVDQAFAVAVDSTDNIAVTGSSNNSYYTIKYDSNGTELWNRTYDGGDFDEATGVAIDPDDNIIVTGYSYNATGDSTNDYYTIKYDPDGNELWNVIYDSGGSDCAQDVAVDSESNIVVTGGSISSEANSTWYYCTVKYYPNGTEFWAAPVTYHLSYPYPAQGELLGTGDGYKTQFTMNYHPIIVGSVKVYKDGVQTTINYTVDYRNGQVTFATPPVNGTITADYTALAGITAFSVAVDARDNVIITGSYYLPSCYAKVVDGISVVMPIYNYYITPKYSPDGTEIWNITYKPYYQTVAYSVAVDSEDNTIVTGKASDGTTWNYLTIKYAEFTPEEPTGGSGGPIAIIVILAIAVVGGTGYYFFIRRRRKAA
jgi:uncharacterized delta-60 repeat protein